MVARDDSVIRGSFIACMIFLVLSIALNFLLWRWGNLASSDQAAASERLNTVNTQVQQMQNQAMRMKAMLGVGQFTEAEIEEMKRNSSDDADMQTIEDQFAKDMSYFGNQIPVEDRNYPALPKFLINAIRDRNEQYSVARTEATTIRTDAEAKIANAQNATKAAETQRDDANKKVAQLDAQFTEDRAKMIQEKEDTKDKLNQTFQDYNNFRKKASDETNKLTKKTLTLQGTIDTQKLELNKLRNDRFETTQGEVRFVVRGGNIVTINLGSGDALRPGVTFGVIDADETRLEDAKVKASIQVTQIQGEHLAQARVILKPAISDPIIPGDKIYSPFWAPGRVVKIALAGDIDIDGDKRPDNEAIKGQIKAAGAVVAAEISRTGVETGVLDASIRFLVIDEDPEVGDGSDLDADEDNAQAIAVIGGVKAKATELGLTVIPVWKLQAYLKTIDDSLTTPLGSAVRGDDFPPESIKGSRSRLPAGISDLYKTQTEGLQGSKGIVSP